MSNDNNNSNNSDFFLLKVIRGEYGLFQTFWFFSFIPSLIFNLFLTIFQNKISDDVRLFLIFLMSLYSILVSIGIWKSANNYLGNKIWVIFSKLSVIMGILVLILSLIALLGISSYNDLVQKNINKIEIKNTPNELPAESKNNLKIIMARLLTDKIKTYYIKGYNDQDYLIYHDLEKSNTALVDNKKFYYDNNSQEIILGNRNMPLNVIFENIDTTPTYENAVISRIELNNGKIYTSIDLGFWEILLICLKPEYIEKIHFFEKAKFVEQK